MVKELKKHQISLENLPIYYKGISVFRFEGGICNIWRGY